MFTPEELAEMSAFDAELDDEFVQTQEEIAESRARDRQAVLDNMDNRQRAIAAYQAAYRAANKDKIAAYQAAYRAANKDTIAAYQAAYRAANKDTIAAYQAAYRAANKDKIADYRDKNREHYNAYMREYMRKKRLMKGGDGHA